MAVAFGLRLCLYRGVDALPSPYRCVDGFRLVCACGAVMRELLSTEQTLYSIFAASKAAVHDDCTAVDLEGNRYDTEKEIEIAALGELKDGEEPMAVLSFLFESRISQFKLNEDVEVKRQRCIDFVTKHFPDTMQIDIDGAKAKDAYLSV